MQFSKVAFEITLFLVMTMLMVFAVALVSIQSAAAIPELLHILGVPYALCVAACLCLGMWAELTRTEWYGYIRAMCLLLGAIVAIPFAIASVINIANDAQQYILVNDAAVCGVGLAMITVCYSLRRRCPSCWPQLKSLFTFRW